MEYQEIKDYLDSLIRIRDEAKNSEKLNSSIEAIMIVNPEIHIYKGIEIIADVMGIKLKSRQRRDGITEFYFNYSKIKFFQLGSSNARKL